MKFLTGSSLALLALVVATAPSHAAKCTDTSGFEAAQEAVDAAAPCSGKRGQFVKKAKKELKATGLSKPCQKLFMKQRINSSTCGRGGFICCGFKGKAGGKFVKKDKQCKAPGKICSEGNSVGTACTPSGDCVTTTTTTTTTSTTTSTTATTLPPRCGDGVRNGDEECDGSNAGCAEARGSTCQEDCTCSPVCGDGKLNQAAEQCDLPGAPCADGGFCNDQCLCEECDANVKTLDFTTGQVAAPAPKCGAIYEDAACNPPVLRDLTCGGLNLGGGIAGVPEGGIPDGGTSRFKACCNQAGQCQLSPTTAAEVPPGVECTSTECFFGPPLGIQSEAPVCVVNTLRENASGTFDRNTGQADISLALLSNVALDQQFDLCPVCVDAATRQPLSGSPTSPKTGVCGAERDVDAPCTTYNSQGLSKDCRPTPNGDDVGPFLLNVDLGSALRPLTTGSLSQSAADGKFCPAQGEGASGTPGCFGTEREIPPRSCRCIQTTGVPAPAPVAIDTAVPVTLASIFCVPRTGVSGATIVDLTGDLPGPGQVSLPGTFVLRGE